MVRKSHFLIAIVLGILQGCATYNRMPLDRFTITQRLMPPNRESIRIQANAIKHPILKPIDFDYNDGLSPDEAAILAVLVNPKLRAVRDQRGIAAAQLFQAGILPNPQLSYSLDIPTGGATQDTINAFGLGLSWDIVSIISRSAKVDAAQAHVASVDLDIAWQEWQVAQDAKIHVYRLVFLEKQLAVAREQEKGLQENLETVKRAVDLGDMTIIDLSAAEAALQEVHLSVLAAQQQREKERLSLNQSLGLPSELIIPLQQGINPPSPKTLPSIANIIDGIEDHRLDLLALKMGYESQEANVRAAVRSQFPRINIGLSHARDTSNVVTTGFGVTIDLPFFDRNQGQIAIERATREQLFDEYTARLFEARSNVASVLADMESVERQIDATEEAVLTLKKLVQTSYGSLLEGNVDVLSYYNERDKLISRQIDVLKLKQSLADLSNALELAAGQGLEHTESEKGAE